MSRASFLPPVAREERPRLVAAMAAFACVASAGLVARTTGSTLFLSTFDTTQLTYMYAAAASAVILASFVIGWLGSRFDAGRVLIAVTSVLIASVLAVRFALSTGWHGAAVPAYLVGELTAKVLALLFWSYAASLFNPREARRLFVLVGLSGTIACIAFGSAIGKFTASFGTANLLGLVMAQLAILALIVWKGMAGDSRRGARGADRRAGRFSASELGLRGDLLAVPHVRHMALLAVASTATLLVTDYLFMSAARARFSGPSLAGFLGTFYSAASFVSLLVQLFVVHQVMRRWGVLAAAVALPAVLLVLSIGMAVVGSFEWTVATKFAEPVLDYTLNAAAIQMLYLGIRQRSRRQARTFVEGFARPATVIVTGLALVALIRNVAPAYLAAVIALASCAWIAACVRAHRTYVSGLLSSLGARRFDLSDETIAFGDELIAQGIRSTLRTAGDAEVLYVLGVIPSLPDVDWAPDFRELLLSRQHPDIKVAALEYLRDHGNPDDVTAIGGFLVHEHPVVRRAAIAALATRAGARAAQEIRARLVDSDLDVRAAATTALFTVGDLDAHIDACLSLKEMLKAEDGKTRAAAARGLASLGLEGMGKVLTSLLEDPDPAVRRAALEACAARPNPALVPLILVQLSDQALAPAAVDALAALGERVLPHLESFPSDAHAPMTDNHLQHIPNVLARTKNPRALEILSQALDVPDVRVRSRVISAYVQLVVERGESKAKRDEVRRAAMAELAAARKRAEIDQSLDRSPDLELVILVLGQERDELVKNALMLAGVLHPSLDVKPLTWALMEGPPDKRAEAVEVLDNVLEGPLKKEMLEILEPVRSGSSPGGSAECLRRLLDAPSSEWVLAGAVYSTGRREMRESLPSLLAALEHPSPHVRETALDAISRLAKRSEVATACERLKVDESGEVRTLAAGIAASLGALPETGAQS